MFCEVSQLRIWLHHPLRTPWPCRNASSSHAAPSVEGLTSMSWTLNGPNSLRIHKFAHKNRSWNCPESSDQFLHCSVQRVALWRNELEWKWMCYLPSAGDLLRSTQLYFHNNAERAVSSCHTRNLQLQCTMIVILDYIFVFEALKSIVYWMCSLTTI